jgi:hypothetical protein
MEDCSGAAEEPSVGPGRSADLCNKQTAAQQQCDVQARPSLGGYCPSTEKSASILPQHTSIPADPEARQLTAPCLTRPAGPQAAAAL